MPVIIVRSTAEIDAKLRVNEEEIRKLQERLNKLGLTIDLDIDEIKRRRNAANNAINTGPLAVANTGPAITPQQIVISLASIIAGIVIKEIPNFIRQLNEREKEIKKIDQTKLDLPNDPIQRIQALEKFVKEKEQFFQDVPTEDIVTSIVNKFKETGLILRIEDVIAEDPEIAKFFDEEIIQDINDAVEKAVRAEKAVNQASEKLSSEKLANDTLDFLGIGTELLQEQEKQIEIFQKLKSGGLDIGSEFSEGKESILDRTDAIKDEIQEKKESIKLNKEDNQSLLDLGKNQSLVTASTKQLTGNIEGQSESLRVGNQILNLTNEELLNLPGKLSMVDGAFIDTTASQGEYSKSIEDVIKNTNEGAVIFGYTKEQLDGLRDVTDEATKSTENLGENGLAVATEKAGQAGKSLGALDGNLLNVADRNKEVADLQEQVNQAVGDGSVVYDDASKSAENYGDTLEQVQNKGGFFEGIKQGFKDFVENVQSNSELMADFFANTLSQMSQNFSDLFFNVITGKFDDLQDLAKQAFEAILRAFLDLVSAIATRQIVISIAGLFGVDTKGASAGDVLGIGKQAAGIGLDLAGVFGGGGGAAAGGAAIAGGATSIGTGTVAIGSGLGGISSVGTGAAAVGATSVLDVSAAGGALGGISTVVPETGGFLAGIGGVAGAITIVGAVLAAAALAFTIIAPLLEKTPRLDIDFDSVKTEAGRRAALVSELLDDDFLKDEIIDISVKRKAGLGLGGDEGIKDVLADAIQDAVNNLLDIINKLPTDLADTLTDELLNTPLDTETEVAGERLFEFDAKGKKIAEKFNQLINGEIQAKFLFAVDGFLQTMFESLGVLPEAAEAFLDEKFEEFKNAGSREARAKVGEELLADINAFVDAFNIVSGNVNDSIGETIQEEKFEYGLAA